MVIVYLCLLPGNIYVLFASQLDMSRTENSDDTRTHTVLIADSMVSHYRIVEKIGAGGMGEVYLARDTKLDRQIALKFLPAHMMTEESHRTRFVREARAAAKLNHPNIVTIHEVGEFEERPFFAMELVEGSSLRHILSEEELSLDRIIDLAIGIAEGLSKAHQSGVVHRDIKSSNIVIDSGGRPKILDFGLAAVSGSEKLTKPGVALGTVAYMSPEQVRGEEIDHRSDLFSFGVVVYELIAGVTPFDRNNDAATMQAIMREAPSSVTQHRPGVPADLQRILSKLLEKDSTLRYNDATEVIGELKKLRKTLPLGDISVSLPSIAVLPFANMSTDPEQEYFCDGIAEDIINDLTNLDQLRVVARTSAFAFKGKNEDIRRIGEQLNVGHVLEGSVRKSGNRLRITAQLINVADGFHLWSERYDRHIEDIFAIQDEISLAIVDKLKLKLIGDEKKKLVKRYTDNVEAYNLYLKGRYYWSKRTEEQFKKASAHFQQAIDIDPAYAPAYVGLADTYILQGVYCHRTSHDVMPLARKAVTKALEIDAHLAEAYASRAHVDMLYDWEWEQADIDFNRSIELNPRYAPGRLWYTLALSSTRRLEEALEQIELARKLDPLSLIINTDVGLIHYLADRNEQAIEEYRVALEIDHRFFVTHLGLGNAYAQLGEHQKAMQSMQEALTLSNNSALVRATMGFTCAMAGWKDEALEIVGELEELAKEKYVSAYSFARIFAGLGNADAVFTWLDRALEERTVFFIHCPISVDPAFRKVSSDPRFSEVLGRSGLK